MHCPMPELGLNLTLGLGSLQIYIFLRGCYIYKYISFFFFWGGGRELDLGRDHVTCTDLVVFTFIYAFLLVIQPMDPSRFHL